MKACHLCGPKISLLEKHSHIAFTVAPRESQDKYAYSSAPLTESAWDSSSQAETAFLNWGSNQASWTFGQELNEIFP